MRKVFLSLVALVAIPAALAAAPITVTYNVGDTATAYSWANLSVHPTLIVDDVITISATHSETASVTNGTYSNSQWYAYKADSMGEFSIAAKKGYVIQSIEVVNNPQKNGVLVEKTSQKEVKSETAFAVNAPVVDFQVINGTSGNICARIQSFTIVYDVLSMSVENQTVKVGDAFQLVAIVNDAPCYQVAWSSDNTNVVAVDANGMINAKAKGTANLTAVTVNGDLATGVITVVENSNMSFIEDYANLAEQVEWKNTNTEYTGSLGQMFRVRNYRFSAATEFTTDVPGVELQYTVNTKSINFIAYANAKQEGGIKAIDFQWRAVDGTKPVIFDVDSTLNKAVMNLVSLPANGGYDKAQTFAKDLNFEQNTQLRIRIADAASSNIVFGEINITPYLLYMQKVDTVETPIASYDCTTGSLLINNVDGEVSYSILEDTSKAAEISNGVLDLSAIDEECDITVQAAWKGVNTTFKLHVNKGTGTGLDENSASSMENRKVVRDGQVVIYRNGAYLNLLGQPVAY